MIYSTRLIPKFLGEDLSTNCTFLKNTSTQHNTRLPCRSNLPIFLLTSSIQQTHSPIWTAVLA